MRLVLLTISLLLVIQENHASSCESSSSNHTSTWGARHSFDRLVFEDHPSFSPLLLRTQSKDVKYPSPGETPSGTISYVEVVDLNNDGSGGCATITDGGVGTNHVTIHVKTQRGQGMDFRVKIYSY